ncbi:ABC transporter permease [Rhodosalinus sp. FB01]|uniref:ABC transporter permease n=1 Tax=Rhodosalinus sp. FB01 TaxID=3239194 RepID=UPI00352671AE
MTDVTDTTTGKRAPTPDDALRIASSDDSGPVLAADGTPLKKSLQRALRAQKLRALALIAPLLIFVLITFIAPIVDMLFRSVENQIVSETLPRTTAELQDWPADSGELPPESTFEALYADLFLAAERKEHTRLGSRLNYESTGMSSLFRRSGRGVDDLGELYQDQFEDLNEAWDEASTWIDIMADPGWVERDAGVDYDEESPPPFELRDGIAEVLPRTAEAYRLYAEFMQAEEEESPAEDEPWSYVYTQLYEDLTGGADLAAYDGPHADLLRAAAEAAPGFETMTYREAMIETHEGWGTIEPWRTIQTYSPPYTTGYFLNAVDMQKSPDGPELRPENERIYGLLFQRTMFMSLMITFSCILLGYPVAWILANLPMRQANLLLILVLLPFWTSLLVRTSAWKVMLQQQGVINDTLVWLGLVADESRLIMINNQFGTIVAMTHILLPFMILPMYSVMQTIPPSYLRAAKSLGATDWTAFWRVYFPQTVPGIGAGSILVFILAIGYYITPEIVGGTTGTFISNRIAYHISSSLNWGLAAALGSILLVVVLVLYWAYDKIVGIDNVKLGG